MTAATAEFWSSRCKRLLDPPADADLRPERLAGDLRRRQQLQADIALTERQLQQLLAATAGQVLTSVPGVATVRA